MTIAILVTHRQGLAINTIARIKDSNGWASLSALKAINIDGRSLTGLINRGLLVRQENSVRLTKLGGRFVQ